MRITSLSTVNLNIPAKKNSNISTPVSFNGIVRPSKLFKTQGSLYNKFHVFWVDVKRNYNVYDFDNAGKIKNNSLLKLPIIQEAFDFCELKLKNVQKVSDKYFRGGVITCEYDILRLKRKGVTDIINLLETQKFNPKLADFAEKQGMKYHRIALRPPYGIPNEQQIEQFSKIISKARGAIYIHCLHGKDRTGVMTFIYEMDNLKKNAEPVIKNMVKNGLHVKKNPFIIKFLEQRYPTAFDKLNKLIT